MGVSAVTAFASQADIEVNGVQLDLACADQAGAEDVIYETSYIWEVSDRGEPVVENSVNLANGAPEGFTEREAIDGRLYVKEDAQGRVETILYAEHDKDYIHGAVHCSPADPLDALLAGEE